MGEKIDINRVARDMFIMHKGEPYKVVDYEHVKPGKGQAFVRVKAKNMKTGNVVEITYKASDSIELADFEQRFAEYSYSDGDFYYFIDKNTYEMIAVSANTVKDKAGFLKEGIDAVVYFHEGQPIGIDLPKTVELQVIETEPARDTAGGGTKPAKLETGLVIQVPMFVKEGDIVKVNTITGQYVERVNR
ncbi:MAG TPA: elongation factor P [Aquifex aeolicus]|uniref:Elongation factor P n=1 Tax=Aquifex aeolicus TaxID=63363 RepID=A0A9D0YP19_AQUAO|nr:elongation factor P [Aquificales bacterium]HIP86417.1 elongation factor P [Aquifex sp.]HIP97832.1 elongation factor P [Aquifex aeolicus]HIQ25854.1 elongation factor P [Aquifex aeolicus]